MLSKTPFAATTLALAVLTASCRSVLPWGGEPENEEVNVAFTLDRNLVELGPTTRIDNTPGRFILGTAARHTVVDEAFPVSGRRLNLSEKESLALSSTRMNLQGVADAIVGADAWRNRSISIDYRSGLVTYHKRGGIERSQMTTFRYRDEPMIVLDVNGRRIAAVVDTSSPDTLVLPGTYGRGHVQVSVAGVDFGTTDVQFANVSAPRIGNRLLSRFLVTIDYGKRVVGLWRDPRIPL
jgi:hypothetical protein